MALPIAWLALLLGFFALFLHCLNSKIASLLVGAEAPIVTVPKGMGVGSRLRFSS
jgi:hypothetical protein